MGICSPGAQLNLPLPGFDAEFNLDLSSFKTRRTSANAPGSLEK